MPRNLRRSLPVSFGAAVLLAGGAGPAHADKIHLKDGRVVEGTVVSKTTSSLRVQDGPALLTLPLSKIDRVVPSAPGEDALLAVKGLMIDGRAGAAIRKFAEAVRAGAELSALAETMFRHEAAILAAIPKLAAAERKALAEAADAASGALIPRRADFLLAEMRWRLALGDAPAAARVLDALEKDHPRELQAAGPSLSGWIADRAGEAIDAGEPGLALDLLAELRRVDRAREGEKRAELALLWGRREREKGNYAKALEIYRDELAPLSPEIARERSAVALAEAERIMREGGRLEELIRLYEDYGEVQSEGPGRDRLIELYREWGTKLRRDGAFVEARLVLGRAEALRPASASKDLDRTDHDERRLRLAPGDALGQYRLGEWALERGLVPEALQAFRAASASEDLKPNAEARIEQVRAARAEERLSELLDLYEKGRHIEVLKGVEDFIAENPPEGLLEQARRLDELNRSAMVLSAAERPQQAEVLLQQAERAFFLGDAPKAGAMLDTLIERFPDTPAAARGLQFRRTIRPRLELDALERRSAASLSSASGEAGSPDAEGEGSASALLEEIRRLRGAQAPAPTTEKPDDASPGPPAADR